MTRKPAILLMIVLLLGIGACSSANTDGADEASSRKVSAKPVADRFDVGDHSLYIKCSGGKPPTVIFEAGLPIDSTPYIPIALELEEVTRTCVYDRASEGRSDDREGVATGLDVVDELDALLEVAEVAEPYVLVGHSFGGLLVMLYAAEHPDEIAGLVLIDPTHPDTYSEFDAVLGGNMFARLKTAEFSKEPVDVDAAIAEFEARRDDLPQVPLTVISAILDLEPPPTWPADRGFPFHKLQRIWLKGHKDYSSMIPGAKVVFSETGHQVQEENLELVIEEIAEVVDKARSR